MDFMVNKGRSMKSFPPGSQGRKSLAIISRKRTNVKQKKCFFVLMFMVEISKHQFYLKQSSFIWWSGCDMVSPYSPDCPRTCYVEQAGNNSRDFPAPASLILGLKVCINMPSQKCSSSPNFLCQMFSLGTPSGLVLAGTPPSHTQCVFILSSYPAYSM